MELCVLPPPSGTLLLARMKVRHMDLSHILCPSFHLHSFEESVVFEEAIQNTSDHLPLSYTLSVAHTTHSTLSHHPNSHTARPNWKKLNSDSVNSLYTLPLDFALGHLPPPPVASLDDLALIDQYLCLLHYILGKC